MVAVWEIANPKSDLVPLTSGKLITPSGVRIPPAWRDIRVATLRSSSVQATGIDSKGRKVYVYSETHKRKATSSKFKRLASFKSSLPKILHQIETDAKKSKEEALVLYLIHKTSFRIGSNTDTKAAKKAYGASTLLGKHIKVNGDNISFNFIGKKGVLIEKTIRDPILAKKFKNKSENELLFNVTDADVRKYFRKISTKFTVKDFRTWRGTALALEKIKGLPIPSTVSEFKKSKKAVAQEVASELGNTPSVALGSYIAPEVFSPWEDVLKAKRLSLVPKKRKKKKVAMVLPVIALIGVFLWLLRKESTKL